MSSRVLWVVIAVGAVLLLLTLIGLGNVDKARKRAEAELAATKQAKAEAEDKAAQIAKAKKAAEAELAKGKESLALALNNVQDLEGQRASLQKSKEKLATLFTAQQLAETETVKAPPEADDADQPAVRPPQPGDWSVPPLLPPDTLITLTVRDTKQAAEKFKQTGLWQMYSNPDIQQAFRAPLLKLNVGIAGAEAKADFKLDALLSFFAQGELTLAIPALNRKNAQGQPFPDWVVSVQTRELTDALMNEIAKRLDQLKAAAGDQFAVTQAPLGNTLVHTVTLPFPNAPQGQLRFQYAACDGNVVAAVGDGQLEKLLAMHEKYKAGPPKPAEGQPPEVLCQVPAYQQALEKAGPDAVLIAYLSLGHLLKNPVLDWRPKTEQERLEREAIGLESIRAISYCVGLRKKGIREATFIHLPVEERKGVLALIEGEAVGFDTLAAAPRNSLAALALRISPERLLDRLVELAALENPNAKEDTVALLAAVGQKLNLDVKKEVFEALTGRLVLSVSVTGRHPKLPVGFPQPILALGVKDPLRLKKLLSATRQAAQDSWEFTELAVGEKEIVTARERFPQHGNPGQLAYALDKDDLLVSLYPLALREELARRAGAAQGASGKESLLSVVRNSLAADSDFDAARKRLRTAPQVLLYVDTGALAVAAYDALIPVAQLAPRNPQVDVTALPTSDLLLKNIGGTVLGFSADKDGVCAESYSPTGAISLLALAPAVLQGRRMAMREGRREANQQEQLFAAIKDGLRAHAAANAGKLPETLKQILPNLGAELDHIVYRGRQDAGNKVVAHTSEDRRGPITLLTQDGTIAQIPRRLLGKVLQEGYKGEALPPPAPAPQAEQKAVKPPRPPEF